MESTDDVDLKEWEVLIKNSHFLKFPLKSFESYRPINFFIVGWTLFIARIVIDHILGNTGDGNYPIELLSTGTSTLFLVILPISFFLMESLYSRILTTFDNLKDRVDRIKCELPAPEGAGVSRLMFDRGD